MVSNLRSHEWLKIRSKLKNEKRAKYRTLKKCRSWHVCVYNPHVLAKMRKNPFYVLLQEYKLIKPFWRAIWLYLEKVTSTPCKIMIPLLDYIPWGNYWTLFMDTTRMLQLFNFFSKQWDAKNNVHRYNVQSTIVCLNDGILYII